jgi:hypothetical protein
MSRKEIRFILPLGYEDENGVFHRKGIMRMPTALDEIEINSHVKSKVHKRYRDCILFSRIITELGELPAVNLDVIEGLYEADFIYLQMLFNKLNLENREHLVTRCPKCGSSNSTDLTDLFSELNFIVEKRANR